MVGTAPYGRWGDDMHIYDDMEARHPHISAYWDDEVQTDATDGA